MSSLLSHCAFFLRSRLVLSDHVDAGGTKLFPQSFTIRELKDALHSYILISKPTSSISSTSLIEAMITSLEMQMFFYNASWKSMERATDDDICILLRCDAYEPQLQPARSKLSPSPVLSVLVSATALDSISTNVPINTAASPSSMISEGSETGCLPNGVLSSLSRCYSSTCDESYPCYSFSCPNRPKRKTFTVQCYSNSCGSGYGCYSPTCPCRYETEPEAEEIQTDISIDAGSAEQIPSLADDPHTDMISGHPTPKFTPKLTLNTTGPLFCNGQNGFFHSPFVSPATTMSTNSFSSSMTPSSLYSSFSPLSPFSPTAWTASSPINVDPDSNADLDFSRSSIAQNLPRIYTHFPHLNSYQNSNLSPYSDSRSVRYASSPVELSTPLSPNWEPLLLISMIGPSIAWVNQERSPLSATSTTTYDDSPSPDQTVMLPSYSYSIPRTNRPFSSFLKSYMADCQTNSTRNEPSETELASPATPYSLTSNSEPAAFPPSSH